MHNRRTRILVDGNLQWRLTRRAIATWLVGGSMIFAFPVCLGLMYGMFVFGQPMAVAMQEIVKALCFPFILALLVVPIGIRDSFRFSNRIAGPMMRMKRNMADLAAGQPIRPITLRPGDFFVDVVESFNQLTEQYQGLQEQVAQLQKCGANSATLAAQSAQAALSKMNPNPSASPPLFPGATTWQPGSTSAPTTPSL